MGQFDLRAILVVLGVLTITTGIVTEILKPILQRIIPTNILVVLVAEGLTLLPGFIYAQLASTEILWYHILAAMVAGYHVACVAMISHDKLQDVKEFKLNKTLVGGDDK